MAELQCRVCRVGQSRTNNTDGPSSSTTQVGLISPECDHMFIDIARKLQPGAHVLKLIFSIYYCRSVLVSPIFMLNEQSRRTTDLTQHPQQVN